jgi:hypothetical protein
MKLCLYCAYLPFIFALTKRIDYEVQGKSRKTEDR